MAQQHFSSLAGRGSGTLEPLGYKKPEAELGLGVGRTNLLLTSEDRVLLLICRNEFLMIHPLKENSQKLRTIFREQCLRLLESEQRQHKMLPCGGESDLRSNQHKTFSVDYHLALDSSHWLWGGQNFGKSPLSPW